jgi:hypothetical protein
MPFIREPLLHLGVTSGRWSLQQATEFPVGRKHCKTYFEVASAAPADGRRKAVAGFPHWVDETGNLLADLRFPFLVRSTGEQLSFLSTSCSKVSFVLSLRPQANRYFHDASCPFGAQRE